MVAVAVPPVAGLDVGVGVGAVTVGDGVGMPVSVPVADGVAVGVAVVPGAAVAVVLGAGVGVQATTGRAFTPFCWACAPGGRLGDTPSGSFHRLEFAVVPPLPRPELGLDVETNSTARSGSAPRG